MNKQMVRPGLSRETNTARWHRRFRKGLNEYRFIRTVPHSNRKEQIKLKTEHLEEITSRQRKKQILKRYFASLPAVN